MQTTIVGLLLILTLGGISQDLARAELQEPQRRLFLSVSSFNRTSGMAERGSLPVPAADAAVQTPTGPAEVSSKPSVQRSRYVRLGRDFRNFLKGPGSDLELNLFDDTVLVAVRERMQTVAPLVGGSGGVTGPAGPLLVQAVPGATVWVGRLKGDPLSSVVLYFQDDGVLAGSVSGMSGHYDLRYAGEGVHQVDKIDPALAKEGPDTPDSFETVLDATAGRLARDPARTGAGLLGDDGTTIDVMVPYTSLARFTANGTSAMSSIIGLAISQVNLALVNSVASAPQVRLVAAFETDYYDASPDLDRDLLRLSTPGDGYWNNLEGLREAYGADLVSLIVDRQDATAVGKAWQWLDHLPRQTPRSAAFSVVAQDFAAAAGSWALAHELGHNMGSNHDRLESATSCSAGYCGQGAFAYSFGRVAVYSGPGADACNFKTIMAYRTGCSGSCPSILNYSTPGLSFSRDLNVCPYAALGISDQYSNSAWNAGSIFNTRGTVSNFRPSVVKADLIAPSPGSALFSQSTTFSWTAGRNITTYLILVGSSVGGSDIANLAGGSLSATLNLPADGRTLYVRLWSLFNGTNYGQYTDYTYVAPTVPVVTSPANGQNLVATGVGFNWTSVTGATGYAIRVVEEPFGALRFSGSLVGSGATSTLVSLPAGSYRFGVRACAGGFEPSQCGSEGTVAFSVSPAAPTGAPAITSPTQGANLTSSTQSLSWTAVTPNPALAGLTYEVLLRNVAAGTTALQIGVASPNLSTIFTMKGSSQYELKVRACQAGCGPYSTPVTFAVTLPPTPTSSPSGVTCSVSGGNSLTCSWNPATNADAYQVQVVQPPPAGPGGGALTVAARQVSATTVTLPVPAGAATAFIAACNGNGCGPNATTGINAAGPNPTQPNLGTPMAGTVVTGPGVLFTWNRIPADNGSNTPYRLFVQDLSRQSTALDVFTTNNFYSAFFKAEGARYDALVVSNPGSPGQLTGPAQGFNVSGASSTAPTMASPAHNSRISSGNIQLGWTPVPGATLYEYFVAVLGQGNASARGVTPGLFAQVPLTGAGGGTVFSGIVRACPAGATCAPGSDAGWGPWSNAPGGPGVTNFTVSP